MYMYNKNLCLQENMYNGVELWLFPDTDISELWAVPGPKAPGLGEFECTGIEGKKNY